VKRLRVLREREEWSRSELARRSGIGFADVGRIESGRLVAYPSQLEKLAQALAWTGDPGELLEEVADHARH